MNHSCSATPAFPYEFDSPQFWQVDELVPTLLGSLNNFAIWNPSINHNSPDSEQSISSSDWSWCSSSNSAPSKLHYKLSPLTTHWECEILTSPSIRNISVLEEMIMVAADKGRVTQLCKKELTECNSKKLHSLNAPTALELYIERSSFPSNGHSTKRLTQILQCQYDPSFYFYDMIQQMAHVDVRINNLKTDARNMRFDVLTLSRKYKKLDNKAKQALKSARKLHTDLHDVRYLDELISLLNGDLSNITLRNWPFMVAHVQPLPDHLNLII